MSAYEKLIMENLKVDADEAHDIEEIMRFVTPTLDHLSKTEFVTLAKHAREANRAANAGREAVEKALMA